MDALVLPGKVCRPDDFESLKHDIESGTNLTESLQRIFAHPPRQLTFITMEEDPEPLLLGVTRFRSGSEAFFSIPKGVALRGIDTFDPARAILPFADDPTIGVDTEWLEARDRKFGIEPWIPDECGVMKIPPATLESVILSYVFSPYGAVDVSRGNLNLPDSKPLHGLRFELTYLGEPDRAGFGETMWVDWEELTVFTGIKHQEPEEGGRPPRNRGRRASKDSQMGRTS